ncbi:MAG: phosphatase PAP2 family protein [Actinomycetota bacterium]|nr:phosphatase PAP2 family protein [Actinomycetota bacterium]
MDKGHLKTAGTEASSEDTLDSVGRAWLAPVAIAAVSASLMLIVALAEGLPLRDPDARYVGSPLALIGLIAGVFLVLDLLPRSWRAAKETGDSFASTIVRVFTERWWGRRGLIVLSALLSFYVTYLSYRNLKSFLPFVTDANFDKELLESERWLFFGNDPAKLLHDLLGSGITAEVLSAVYLAFLTFVPISLAIALIWSKRLKVGITYVTALSICWILGALSYYLLPALGPVFAEPGVFAALPDTGVTRLQDTLLEHRNEVLANPHATNAVQSVAAFASLHTGVLFAAALVAHRARSQHWVRYGLWALLGLTMIATVYFGWHYIIDDFAGLIIGAVAVFGGERLMALFGSTPAPRRALIREPVPGSSRAAQ